MHLVHFVGNAPKPPTDAVWCVDAMRWDENDFDHTRTTSRCGAYLAKTPTLVVSPHAFRFSARLPRNLTLPFPCRSAGARRSPNSWCVRTPGSSSGCPSSFPGARDPPESSSSWYRKPYAYICFDHTCHAIVFLERM